FTTTVSANTPVTFVWKKNGATLTSGVSLGGRATINITNGSGTATSTLSISNSILSDADTYTVDATSSCNKTLNQSATLTVVQPPTVTKAFGASSIPLNGVTMLTFTLTNPNPSVTLTGVGLTDVLPGGLTVATAGPAAGCGGSVTTTAPGTSSFSSGSLAANTNCQFSVTVTGSIAGVWNNTTGMISSTEGGTGTTSNTAVLTVIGPPSISKAF